MNDSSGYLDDTLLALFAENTSVINVSWICIIYSSLRLATRLVLINQRKVLVAEFLILHANQNVSLRCLTVNTLRVHYCELRCMLVIHRDYIIVTGIECN